MKPHWTDKLAELRACPEAKLDEKGRCCGRKPLRYKSGFVAQPGWFCPRCDRHFNVEGEQVENFFWKRVGGEWKKVRE